MSLRKAAEMALESWDFFFSQAHPEVVGLMYGSDWAEIAKERTEALRQALAQPEQKTPLKVLNLTVFTENRLRNGRVYDVETLQAMTSRDILAIPDMGKKALKEVLEALDVYAVNMSQERVDETAKCKQEPYGYVWTSLRDGMEVRFSRMPPNKFYNPQDIKPVYTAPPKREWVGLTDEEVESWRGNYDFFDSALVREVEAKLKEKNSV